MQRVIEQGQDLLREEHANARNGKLLTGLRDEAKPGCISPLCPAGAAKVFPCPVSLPPGDGDYYV